MTCRERKFKLNIYDGLEWCQNLILLFFVVKKWNGGIKMALHVSQYGINLIKKFEGCPRVNGIITAYKDCVGVLTLAWGHTGFVKFFNKNVCVGMTVTDAQGTELLQDDLVKYENKITSFCNSEYLTQNKLDALTSFELNTGAAKSSTIFTLFNQGDMQGAADQFLRWNRAGGKVVSGLSERRKKERELFLSDGTNVSANTTTTVINNSVSEDTIKAVQTWLKNYDKTIVIDGKSGNGTRRALAKALQTELNNLGAKLTVDGAIGTKTFDSLSKYGLVKLNSNGNIVKVLEGYLYIKNYNPQDFSGEFNDNVKNAVKQYQSEHSLTADGICGINSWKKIIG